MGRESRRDKTPYRVRTAEEVTEQFRARLDQVTAALDASRAQRGNPSFDRARAQGIQDGRVRIHADGSETVAMTPELRALIDLQLEMFRFKFGRAAGPDDPIFFDPEAATPQVRDADSVLAMLRAAAQRAGVDPDRAIEHFFGRAELDEYKQRTQ
jgi:hypothetical protein